MIADIFIGHKNRTWPKAICIGYIPGQRDIPVISRGRGQCLSGAEEVPRAKPEALPRQNESMSLGQNTRVYTL